MIITCLGGGLGNQMFQYAFGRKLAVQNKDTLLLDTSIYDLNKGGKHYREYGLHHFNIPARIATSEQIEAVKSKQNGLWRKLWRRFELQVLRRRHVKFEPHMLKKKGDVYLQGFWQSEKYFKDVRPILLKEFSLKKPFSQASAEVAAAIRSAKNSVSIHVRRGDYTESKESKDYFGTHCDEAYYLRALDFISQRKGDLTVFVFSDDTEWVKENFHIPHAVTYVSEKGGPDYERLALMSLCQHHVIANSTFGWWGAWLDDKPGRIIVGPYMWTPGPRLPVDHILPPEWVRL